MNIIKVGRVSAVDAAQLRIRATFPDRDHLVSGWLQLIMPPISLDEHAAIRMPNVGQTVLCVFLGNGLETGYWLGVIE
ncbi:phage baseplate assembly protein V [Xylanibacillus composti]|nr:phage baseplate assembly protein V [Xylanibacillus composti]